MQRDIELNSRKSVTLDLNASSATLHRSAASSTTNTASAGTPNEDYGFNQLRSAKKKGGGILKTASSASGGSKEQFFNFGKSSTSSALSATRRGSLKMGLDELETANCHLRRMVDSLFVELEHCQRENNQLRGRVSKGDDGDYNIYRKNNFVCKSSDFPDRGRDQPQRCLAPRAVPDP